MANELRMIFSDVTTTVIDLTTDLTNTSVGGGQVLFDNSANWPYAVATFNNPGTFGAAPLERSTVNLFAVLQDVDGTSDDTSAPASADVESARFMGAFPMYDADKEQRVTINILIDGIKKAYFYIENRTGQSITGAGSHIYVKITPYSIGPV
jgi:hypothetical protein